MNAIQEHSPVGASGAYRWMACPGSVALCRLCAPSESSVYARDGTLAHKLAEKALVSRAGISSELGTTHVIDGMPTTVTEEILTSAVMYAETVLSELGDGVLEVEKAFNLDTIHPDLWGTADAVVYYPDTGNLRVYDLKHGMGVVEVEDNPQLLYYALGVAHEYPARPLGDVEIVVVQPRAPHPDGRVRRMTVHADALIEFEDLLTRKHEATTHPSAPLVAGKHCKFCAAAAGCPSLYEYTLDTVKAEFGGPALEPDNPSIEPPTVTMLSVDKLAFVLDRTSVVEKFLADVRERATAMARSGVEIPGYKMVDKIGRRAWIDEENALKVLSRMKLKKEALLKTALKTPAQVEKLLKNATPLRLRKFNALFQSVSSGVTLVAESDQRPAAGCEFTKADELIEEA